jgi:hypothetical protein
MDGFTERVKPRPFPPAHAFSAHLEAASARLLNLIREFDARGGWCNGFRSGADWLCWRIGLDLGTAREKVRVARALATLPLPRNRRSGWPATRAGW